MRALEDAVLAELDTFRADPRAYVVKLEALKKRFRGSEIILDDSTRVATNEGPRAVDEAIAFMRRGPPSLPPYRHSERLTAIARAHAEDLGRHNLVGHIGSDGSTPEQRGARRGVTDGFGEVVAHGTTSGEDTIVGLLVDDGVRDRGHRTVMYLTELHQVGVGCAAHPTYRTSCVIDFAP